MVELVDESDFGTADLGSGRVRKFRSGDAIHIDLACIGMLEQSSDVQESGFAGSRGTDKCHRFSRPDCELRAVENFERNFALTVASLDGADKQRRLLFSHRARLTRSAVRRLDPGVLPARTDRASQGTTMSAP